MQKPYRDFLGTLYWCRGWHGFWVFKNAHPFLLNSKEILKFIYTLQWNILVSIQIYVLTNEISEWSAVRHSKAFEFSGLISLLYESNNWWSNNFLSSRRSVTVSS